MFFRILTTKEIDPISPHMGYIILNQIQNHWIGGDFRKSASPFTYLQTE